MKDINHRKRALTLIVILLACMFMLAGCESVAKEQYEEVTATVTDLQINPEHNTVWYNPALKMPQLKYHATEYNVTVTYEDLSQDFNNQDLYDSVKVGDSIKVILYQGWDSKGKLLERELRISKEPH